MKRSIAAIISLSAMCSLPVSAGEINQDEHYKLEGIHTLVISQKEMNPITIGINVVPISTSIGTYPGSVLLISIKGNSFLGTAKPPQIEADIRSGILNLEIGYRYPFKAGLRAGNINIEILIPESYAGNLRLEEMKSPTEIEKISLESFYALMRDSRLTIQELYARRIDIESKGDAKIECITVHSEQWRVKFGSGAFIAEEISGQVELENFNGKTDIAFSRFEGRSTLRSGGGNITVRLPESSNLEMELVSGTQTAKSEFNLIGESSLQKKGHISGLAGEASDKHLFARSRFGKVRVLTIPGEE